MNRSAQEHAQKIGNYLKVKLMMWPGLTCILESVKNALILTIMMGLPQLTLLLLLFTSSVFGAGYYNTTFLNSSQATPFTWTGKTGDGNFTTAGNWWGGVAPTTTSAVIFNPKFCSSTCNVTIDGNISVLSLTVKKSYTGTITQTAARTITVGNGGWMQDGGTFVGSSTGDAITVNGNFLLTGGSFTATSGTFQFSGSLTVANSPTFNANNGTFKVVNTGYARTITPGSISFNNFHFDGGPYDGNLIAGTMKVTGNLSTSNNDGRSGLNGGTIEVSGNVIFDNYGFTGNATIKLVGTSSQNISSNGTPNLPSLEIASTGGTVNLISSMVIGGNFIYTSGTVIITSPTISFSSGPTLKPGNLVFKSVKFVNGAYAYITITGTLKVNNDLTFSFSNNRNSVDTGTIEVSGNVITTTSTYIGSALVKLVGSGNQSITGPGNLPNLEIASTGGTVSFATDFKVGGNFTYTSGSLNVGTATISFNGPENSNTVSAPGIQFNDVVFEMGPYCNYFISGTLQVNNLSFAPYDARSGVGSGTIAVKGNITLNNLSNVSTTLSLVGTSTQTYTSPNYFGGNIIINSASSTLLLANDLNMNASGQTLSITAGSVDQAGHALATKSLVLNGNTLTKNGGVLTVNGSVTGSGSLYGGTVNP